METEPLTAKQVCAATGVTYRQLDYWCRLGAVNVPGNGPGSEREFLVKHLRQVAVMARLRKLGASIDVCSHVGKVVAELPPSDWYYVTDEGRVFFQMTEELLTGGTAAFYLVKGVE